MAMHPVGPLAASTYWRRRGVLAIGLIVVLLLLRSCASGGSSRPAASGTPLPTPVPSATTASPAVVASVQPRPSATPTKVTPTSAAKTGTCRDADLSLVASTDSPSYAAGSAPLLTLRVRNTSSTSCRRDLGSGAVELRVLSGTDRIWSSDDCSTARGTDVRTLEPGASRSVQVSWSGKRSRPGCAGPRTQALAGTYRLVVRVGSARRDGATFTFR